MYFVARPEGAESGASALPPVRDRMPTIPYDLTEYAWLHTGPASWSAEPDRGDPRRQDVVYLVDDADDDAFVLDDVEAYVLSLVAPQATVADVVDLAGIPTSEVLTVLAKLTDRGVVRLERATPASR